MSVEYREHDVAVYGGYIEPESKILQSASGGIATALSEQMIANGGYVVGVAYTGDFHSAEYIITNEMDDLQKLKGSKYFDPPPANIYVRVKALLEQGAQVLFIGLPCKVAALYAFIGSRPDNLVTCELICYGPTLSKVHEDYVTWLEKKHKSKVVDFSVRYKEHGWTPKYLYAEFSDGQIFKKPFSETEYGYAFGTLALERCYSCKFKGNNRKGDIMVGDFWGATEQDAFWNKNGVSVVFAETEKGNAFLSGTKNIKLVQTTFEQAVEMNRRVILPRPRDPRREEFLNRLQKNGLMRAVPIKRQILRIIPPGMLLLFRKAKGIVRRK